MAVKESGGGWGAWIAIAVVAVVVWQCTRDRSSEEGATESSSAYADAGGTGYAPSPAAEQVEGYRSPPPYVGSGYQDAGAPYGCTQDCSGHEAGWSWAEENGLTDPDDCGGNSLSFEEGCMAYAEEQQAEQPDEDRW